MSVFRNRLVTAIHNRGIKPSQLAQKTGIDRGSISCYITGRYEPKGDKLFLIAKALKVSPEWLSGQDVPMDLENTNPTAELVLSDGERALVEMFRSASPYQREIILQLLAAKITPKE